MNETREEEDLISTGIAFQTEGAEWLEARLPNLVRHLGMVRVDGWKNAECVWIWKHRDVEVKINGKAAGRIVR